MVDAGHINEAKSAITLLLSYGDLEPPLKQSLMQQVSQPIEGYRLQLEQFINQQQPFLVSYGRPDKSLFDFTVYYAELNLIEKRLYLQVWCQEVEDNRDIPELKHNRTLRLDRIQALAAIDGQWRGQLDSIDVEIHLLRGLARAYEARFNDVVDERLDDLRRVIRRIHNTFWFFREVHRYGADCVIVGPEHVRDRYVRELANMMALYAPKNR
ncbi:MAG: WYL domain-containing protein [Leptolyngbya sp. SIO4C5]|nr:WYL domain-containing protein [Leptolyngbya sp. SIO4C5]